MSREELIKILEKVEWATLNVAIQEKYGCLLIPEEKWEAVSDALYNEVGGDRWNPSWDY